MLGFISQNFSLPSRYTELFLRSCGSKESKPLPNSYKYETTTKHDYDEISSLLEEAFFPREPIHVALGLTNVKPSVEELFPAVAGGLSIAAKYGENLDIIGACINKPTNYDDPDELVRQIQQSKNENLKKLLEFKMHWQKTGNLWECYKVQRVFHIIYVFVKKEHQRKQIAKKLIEISRFKAKEKGFKIVRCDATSKYIAQICEKLGMEKFTTMLFCEYIDGNMKHVLYPEAPHEAITTYIDNNQKRMKKIKIKKLLST